MEKRRIYDLPENFTSMKDSCLKEGFHFLSKMEACWLSGENTFSQKEEALFVALEKDIPVGICGLNVDPYTNDKSIGRVRHLYIVPAARRKGLAKNLVEAVTDHAKNHFDILRLRTNNPIASQFYENLGFSLSNEKFETHLKVLKDPDKKS
ncbi:MAG: GNAT family N-acetyltransferase [Bdellovibrionaceae bacterium]|nr:GNAT family N-acetyltransferase [Pseudobdellovibrionaceae bacterium]|tara:strand:- start:73050 stop:73502 length:453 start_codon:yes stop_codon:yes gene_type:complete